VKIFPKISFTGTALAAGSQTPGVSWLTVLLGGGVLLGNTIELGGVQPAAKEWTAWMLAGLAMVHGVCMAWRWSTEDAEWRLPRWPLWASLVVVGLGCAARRDLSNPEAARETFYLAAEAWLLCWVVAASPGGRAFSWAWLMVVVAAASLALVAATGWQSSVMSRWLPLERRLPSEWAGHWSGTLPLPAAFGALLVLAGAPLLVMACSRHLPAPWRVLSGSGGMVMLLGALLSYSLGAWLGVAYVLFLLPVVAANSRAMRITGLVVALALLGGAAGFLVHGRVPGEYWVAPLMVDETPFAATRSALAEAWSHDPWLGGHGATMTDLARASGEMQSEGGWSFAFSDWLELAVAWGMAGLGLVAIMVGGLLAAAWSSWARLPFLVAMDRSTGDAADVPADESSKSVFYTPEAKVLLAAAALGLSSLVVAMGASRALNVPAVVFAAAVVAGVLARNVPQRGGTFRLDPATRGALSLGGAAIAAILLVGKVAPAFVARDKLERAESLLVQIDQRPNAAMMARAEAALREVLATNAANGTALTDLAWLRLEMARLDPEQFLRYSVLAENTAQRASEYAPNAPEPWIVRGLACLLANRTVDATRLLQRALDLAPHSPEAQYYANTIILTNLAAENGPPQLRLLPPRYLPPALWPPLEGESRDAPSALLRP